MNRETNIPAQEDTPTFILTPEHAPGDGPLPIGYRLDSRYEILDVRGGAGKSGMGIVYIVRDEDGKFLAVKTFQRRYARDLGFVQRFIREASLWMQAGFHPNIIHAYRVDIINAIPYLFMEYVPTNAEDCLSLADQLAFGPVPLPEALDYAVQFCDGMAHATQAVPGLVHRDIKPENLLIDPEGVLKITDFGLVRATAAPDDSLQKLAERSGGRGSDPNLTGAGAVMGTPVYMSPEQFSGAGHVTMVSDIYSFGCCFYEMLTCFQPFRVKASSTIDRVMKLKVEHRDTPPPPLRARVAEAPAALESLLLRCMEKDAAKRWPDFGTLGDALRAIAAAEGIPIRELPALDATPAEVVAQMRSATLLEGYGRAIQLRALRETQEESPYAFHLVLASYFHYDGDLEECQEQLCKAFRARDSELGYEAARQLVLLLLDAGQISGAAKAMENFLDGDPNRRSYVREAWVQLQCAQGHCDAAERYLDECEEGLRTDALRLALYRTRKDHARIAQLARHILDQSLDTLAAKAGRLTPESVVGWGRPGDADLLRSVAQQLRPALEVSVLDVAEGVVWPDLDGYPDFAPDLAWISEALGTLGQLGPVIGETEAGRFRDLAAALDYPKRMRAHLVRDEHWFWTQSLTTEAR